MLSAPCLTTSFISPHRLHIPNCIAAHNPIQARSHPPLNFSTVTALKMKMTELISTNPLTELKLPTPLVLGSGSFTRKIILKEMNIPYILKVNPIDERNIGDRSDGSDPSILVMTLAKAKSRALISALLDPQITNCNADNNSNKNDTSNNAEDKYEMTLTPELQEGCIILTADQVVTHSNSILEKPDDIEQAKEFISKYASSPPSTVGSVVLTHLPSNISVSGVDISTIYFKASLGEEYEQLVDRLLEDGAPILSCAGGLMIEHPFVEEFIERIDGTQDGVMGLSKDLVLNLLKELKENLEKEE